MLPAEDLLITQYAPLVRRQALIMVGRLPANVELDDLIQAGMLGLLDAVRRYRERPDAQFETYAVTRIRGAMLDELRAQDWLPRSVRAKSRRVEDALHALTQRLLRPPTEIEVASEMGLSLTEYREVLEDAHGMQIVMAEDLSSRPDAGRPAHVVSDQGGDPLIGLLRGGLRAVLVDAIERLPEREQLLLSLQFERDLNQKEIAAVLGVTEGRISQLRSQAIARLRNHLAEHCWESADEAGGYEHLL